MSKDENWVRIFSTTELFKAKLIEAVFKENNIAVNLLNKQDSAYVVIGDIEIYIQAQDQEKAQTLLASIEQDLLENK